MRQIEFRGKMKNRQDWIFGHYSKRGRQHTIRANDVDVEINVETLGQYTGLKDKNGVKIFEGNIYRSRKEIGFIEFQNSSCFCVDGRYVGGIWKVHLCYMEQGIEIIGNIHDNPELLGEKNNE